MSQRRIYGQSTGKDHGWQLYEMASDTSGQITHYAIAETIAGDEHPVSNRIELDSLEPHRYRKPVAERYILARLRTKATTEARRLMAKRR